MTSVEKQAKAILKSSAKDQTMIKKFYSNVKSEKSRQLKEIEAKIKKNRLEKY